MPRMRSSSWPCCILRGATAAARLRCSGAAWGLVAAAVKAELGKGDRVFFYTDGLLAPDFEATAPEATPSQVPTPGTDCSLCPSLARFRATNRRAHPNFFNSPVPSFGVTSPRLLIKMFGGDTSL